MARIAIVLATYNGAQYLPQMLDSLLAQTRPADIVVAVDDGSKDRTPEILKSYQDTLPLQITCLEKNSGHRAAFSRALQIVQPQLEDDDLIALADQDDIWLPQKLKHLEERIQDASLILGDAQVIDAKGNIIGNSWRKMDGIPDTLSLKAILTGFTNVTGCMTLFKAGLLKKILPIPEKVPVHDQWIAFCACMQNGNVSIEEPVIQYRIHGQNAIGLGHTHTWTGNLNLNLQWASMITETPRFSELSAEDQAFLTHYIAYIRDRLQKSFIPRHLTWVAKNAHSLYPHVTSLLGLIPRIIYGIVGAPIITRLPGRT